MYMLVFITDHMNIVNRSTTFSKENKNDTLSGTVAYVFDEEEYEKYGDIGDNSYFWKKCKIMNIKTIGKEKWIDVQRIDGRNITNLKIEQLKF